MDAEPKTVKVFNLTDIETPNLKKRGLVSQHVAITGGGEGAAAGSRMCEPGQFVEVVDSPELRANVKHLVSVGALSLEATPPPYRAARLALDATSGRAPIAHVDVKETKVADSAPPAPPVATDGGQVTLQLVTPIAVEEAPKSKRK